jgi:hypothetical protein
MIIQSNSPQISIENLLPKLSPARKRIVEFLVKNGKCSAGVICHTCAIGNLSHAVNKMQPILNSHGLAIKNYPPQKPLINSFGEKSQVHYWELVKLDG